MPAADAFRSWADLQLPVSLAFRSGPVHHPAASPGDHHAPPSAARRAPLDEHRITFMSSVPSIWRLALKLARPPSAGTLQRVHCGSAPLSAHVWEEIRQWTGTRQVCNA
ncbi:AMP-binding protein [Accumulibacter sp.]|uniref:AMP-binding protein n=1 Tax=Accumulibacter sp. TaxID=2053492 RepID=UPI002D1FB8B8|nr:AMP-binding protein [Accumulibacter sp.]